MPDPLQFGCKLLWLPIGFRALAEAVDRSQKFRHVGARRQGRSAIYHNSV